MTTGNTSVPILDEESELRAARILEVIGGESIRAFAGRLDLSDSLVGAYTRGEKEPGVKNLVTIADAGGVLVDWLATGREPKTRDELKALQDAAGRNATPLDVALLQGVIDFFYRWLEEHRETVRIDRARHGKVIAVLYKIAAASGKADPDELSQVMQLAA